MYLPRLKELREKAEKGQKEIADLLKISQQQYSLYETGAREIKLCYLITLSKYYRVSIDYMLGLTDKK
ncbi:helix-turn-helix transcriptional regulator [Caproiciproducens galactitolivorans]|uniref:Helix-turn-helix transcriptional regulator n=1 Tax=Caproiciproducens galactitolivorans TaxID=642589 RepID=A0ABT4BSP9_9FIRM|nr:helix-turn-helix transcriptional regulator [Caproiciproducens galactitolivorans]